MNSLLTITPYKSNGIWMFDDENAGLKKEPFVCGIGEMIDLLVVEIHEAKKGFNMIFSSNPFPGYQVELIWMSEDFGGNWYFCKKYQMDGWLCPALFKYFDEAPRRIYVKAIEK